MLVRTIMKQTALELSDEMLDAIAQRFRLLGEPVRLRLLRILETGEHGVNQLTEKVGGNQANVSRHLTAMYNAGVLKRRREGTSVYYTIADPTIFQLCKLMCSSAQEVVRMQLSALSPPPRTRGRR